MNSTNSFSWPKALLIIASLVFASSAIAQNSSKRIHDPLSVSESQVALSMARERSRSMTTGPFQRFAAAVGVAQPNEPVFLMMERDDAKKAVLSGSRVARAFYYDYDEDQLLQIDIDVETQQVLATERADSVQLPLVDSEINRAFDLVLSNSSFRADLEHAYRNVTGREFQGRNDVNYKAFVFHSDSVAGGLNQSALTCGQNRCAQLLIYSKDNFSLEFAPLVNLSTGEVVQNLERRVESISRPQPSYTNPLARQPWEHGGPHRH